MILVTFKFYIVRFKANNKHNNLTFFCFSSIVNYALLKSAIYKLTEVENVSEVYNNIL